jgi:hypothetical protein
MHICLQLVCLYTKQKVSWLLDSLICELAARLVSYFVILTGSVEQY